MTHSSFMRSTVSPNHRPFTTMACFSMARPGSTVPKAYHNGKHDSRILCRTSYLCLQWNSAWSVILLRYPHRLVGSVGNILGSCTCIGMLVVNVLNPTARLNNANRVNMLTDSVLPLSFTRQRRSIPTMQNTPLFSVTGTIKSTLHSSSAS